MSKLDLFRKLIREEVRQVFREEIKSVLSEIRQPAKVAPGVARSSFKESLKESIPTRKPAPAPSAHPDLSSQDPIKRLLAETAMGMDADEYRTMVNADSNIAQGFPQMIGGMQGFEREARVVDSVAEMLTTSHPVADVSQVTIDAVPDFSNLMATMKNRGEI